MRIYKKKIHLCVIARVIAVWKNNYFALLPPIGTGSLFTTQAKWTKQAPLRTQVNITAA